MGYEELELFVPLSIAFLALPIANTWLNNPGVLTGLPTKETKRSWS